MIDELEVLRRASDRIGIEAPETLDDDITQGVSARSIYEAEVDLALGLNDWSFGRKLVRLSREDAKPIAGYSYIHILPTGDTTHRLQRVIDQPERPEDTFTDLIVLDDRIYSNVDDLYAVVRYRSPPHLWNPVFTYAVVIGIAGVLADSVAQDRMATTLRREAYGVPQEMMRGGLIAAAMQSDSATRPSKRLRTANNPLTRAWRG